MQLIPRPETEHFLSPFTPRKKKKNPVQCPRGGAGCVCDVSLVKIAVETMTWLYLPLNLVAFCPSTISDISCLRVTIFSARFHVYFFHVITEATVRAQRWVTVCVGQSLQAQRMWSVCYSGNMHRSHVIEFNKWTVYCSCEQVQVAVRSMSD